MSLGEPTTVTEEDVDVMLAVTRLAYATSDLSRDLGAIRSGGRRRGRMSRRAAGHLQDRVFVRACRAMEGFVCGGEEETPERLAYRIEDRVCRGMSWFTMFFFRHLVSWAISFIIQWMLRDLEFDDEN